MIGHWQPRMVVDPGSAMASTGHCTHRLLLLPTPVLLVALEVLLVVLLPPPLEPLVVLFEVLLVALEVLLIVLLPPLLEPPVVLFAVLLPPDPPDPPPTVR